VTQDLCGRSGEEDSITQDTMVNRVSHARKDRHVFSLIYGI
jgi:hypothetical protein